MAPRLIRALTYLRPMETDNRWQIVGKLIFVVFLITALVFVARLKTSPTEDIQSSSLPTVPLPSVSPGQFVHVVDTRRGVGQTVLQTGEGSSVVLQVITNQNDTVVIEGYNLSAKVSAGDPAVFRFAATQSGMFDVRLEQDQKVVGLLWVAEKPATGASPRSLDSEL